MSVVIQTENISKCFRRGNSTGVSRLSEAIYGVGHAMWQKLRSAASRPAKEDGPDSEQPPAEFWALKDINLAVRDGESVGLIGTNGAGKSTLLKVLTRIVHPTTGRFAIRGRVASLLEVGTGFHPELTGRENVYLSGTILGLNRREIRDRFDAIVDFSGIEAFIDTPVKRYSSGMYVRLGFSVAASLDPDVLIVDEALAVGDAAFQRKCQQRIREIRDNGQTILFVTHSMNQVLEICDRAIWMEKGSIKYDGDPEETASMYLDSLDPQKNGQHIAESDFGRILSTRIHYPDETETRNYLDVMQEIEITIDFELLKPHMTANVRVILGLVDGTVISGHQSSVVKNGDTCGEPRRLRCRIPRHLLCEHHYRLRIVLVDVDGDRHLVADPALSFHGFYGEEGQRPAFTRGPIHPEIQLNMEEVSVPDQA